MFSENEFPQIPSKLLDAMQSCDQEPAHHAEGNVAMHTGMVVEATSKWLRSDQGQELSADRMKVLQAAALWHDVGKPAATRLENGKISSPNHARIGANILRAEWYRAGVDFKFREEVAGLVRNHQIPFHVLDRPAAEAVSRLIRASLVCRCSDLAALARADSIGRISLFPERIADMFSNVELFFEFAKEQDCLEEPRHFPSDHSRFQYFRQADRDPKYLAYDDCQCEVVMMSGFPASGKDTWIKNNLPSWPIVSLDDIRNDLDIHERDGQGQVVQEGRERCRELLRQKKSFVFNATNLTAQIRQRWIRLFADYLARIRIVCIEAPYQTILERNRKREGHALVPQKIIERMIDNWEAPDLTEAHEVIRLAADIRSQN